MIELPQLADYSSEELAQADWPALVRYLEILKKKPSTPSESLRVKRHEAWLRCGLATRYDRAEASSICRFWSDRADELIREAWTAAGGDLQTAILALGKLGSRELNLSSDVDLVLVRKDDRPHDAKVLREFQALLSETTDFGYCLRVDLTLRPGGRSASPVPSFSEFEYHYGYHGEMWERLAYVRMRPLSGDPELLRDLTEFTRKFSFRRHLDYTLLEELKGLRAKIRAEKFESRPGLYHLKLGEGGIRDLELFVHALQVIHGGRNPRLRTRATTEAIDRLKETKVLPEVECDFLAETYWFLRDLENRLHAYEDQQNYLLDLDNPHVALPKGFVHDLNSRRARVNSIVVSLFGEEGATGGLPISIDEQSSWLESLGFSRASRESTWPELLAATALSRMSERDENARLEFLRGFVTKVSESGLDRDLGLSLLLDFVKAVRAKASFFTLLNRETRVRDDLALLFSVSPYLGSLLASRPELIDEFIYRKQAETSTDLGILLEELAERRLLAELIAANHFLSDRDLDRLTSNLTDNADSICTSLLSALKSEYGPSEVALLAMGKWGGRELGLRSDLDFVFVVPDEPTVNDQKVSRRYLSRITEPHRGGSIYSIDMRLRPSGNAGPMLVSARELETYLQGPAAAWERQAYLRARLVAGSTNSELNAMAPAKVAASRGLSTSDVHELASIRSKLFVDEKPGELDLKLTHGGLADVEFTAQIALLDRREFSLETSTAEMIQYLEGVDAEWNSAGSEIRMHYSELRRVEQLYQLTTSQSGSKMRVNSDEFKRLASLLSLSPSELESRVRDSYKRIRERLKVLRVLERSVDRSR